MIEVMPLCREMANRYAPEVMVGTHACAQSDNIHQLTENGEHIIHPVSDVSYNSNIYETSSLKRSQSVPSRNGRKDERPHHIRHDLLQASPTSPLVPVCI